MGSRGHRQEGPPPPGGAPWGSRPGQARLQALPLPGTPAGPATQAHTANTWQLVGRASVGVAPLCWPSLAQTPQATEGSLAELPAPVQAGPCSQTTTGSSPSPQSPAAHTQADKVTHRPPEPLSLHVLWMRTQ